MEKNKKKSMYIHKTIMEKNKKKSLYIHLTKSLSVQFSSVGLN